MPLLKRSTQIQPPGNTWCSAASSIGYGGVPTGGRSRSQRSTPSKCVKSPCVGGSQRRGASARPSARCRNPRGPLASIDEARGDAHGAAVALAFERRAIAFVAERARAASCRGRRRPRPRPPARARGRSPADTSACRRSRRAGSPRPAAAASRSAVVLERLARAVEEEGEAALQAARRRPDASAATCPTSRTAGSAAGRSGPPAPRSGGWRAAWTTRRWRSADDGRAR